MSERCASYEHDPYDIVVVGAGHAGCEAALAATRLGCRTASILNLDMVAMMACNPSLGGPGKGTWCAKLTPSAARWRAPLTGTFTGAHAQHR